VKSTTSPIVMPGLDPGIHSAIGPLCAMFHRMDCRVKPGNDDKVGWL
jgi:hypothetical protein